MEKRAVKFGLFEVGNTIINVSVTLVMLLYYNYGWYSRAIGITVAYSIFFVIGFFVMWKNSQIKFRYDRDESRKILNVSIPLIPHAIGSIIIAMSDRIFIERMTDLKTVGIYSVGYMFGMIVMLFSEAFLKAWGPWFYEGLSRPTDMIKRKIVRYTYIFLIFLILLATGVTIFSKLAMPVFVDVKYHGALDYVFWIACGYIFFGVYQIFFPYLVVLGKTNFLAISTTTAALINLALNYFFINWFGPIGAAYSTVVAFAVSSLMVFVYQNRHYPMPWNIFAKQNVT
jgi:O-antigen/teichoic acid export membrane protein